MSSRDTAIWFKPWSVRKKSLEEQQRMVERFKSVQRIFDGDYNQPPEDEFRLKAMELVCSADDWPKVAGLIIMHKLELMRKELELQAAERKRIALKAQKLNKARHRNDHQARAKAIKEWEKSIFPSAEKAGVCIAGKLAEQGFHYEPRTVTTWIRAHVKQIGKKLR